MATKEELVKRVKAVASDGLCDKDNDCRSCQLYNTLCKGNTDAERIKKAKEWLLNNDPDNAHSTSSTKETKMSKTLIS